MKKKSALIALLLAGAMAFGGAALTGCKNKEPDDGDDGQHLTDGDGTSSDNNSSNDTSSDNTSSGNTPSGGGNDTPSGDLGETYYTVKFMDGNTVVSSESVESGKKVLAPTRTKAGHYLKGWYENAEGTGNSFDFDSAINGAKTLYAVWAAVDARLTYNSANNEGASFEWGEGDIANAKVEYKLSSASQYTRVDGELIRQKVPGTARVDVVGLKGGEKYDFKITPTSGNVINVTEMAIAKYDRSGYAHFNYSDGVGAYNDDGTLKDNALVIYVTDENKNSVSTGYVNGQKVDLSQYLWQGKTGIGWILNNRGYDNNTSRENYGIQKLCFTYGAVDIRMVGKVNAEAGTQEADAEKSLIDGLTVYNSTGNGGSVGDNGRMARICNAKNLTIEGIGEDASMHGWGVHFVSNDNLHKYDGAGKSFEVRNLTFANYPEDAIGMEGTQGTKVDANGSITAGDSSPDADLISPVERCWVHNNVFQMGFSSKPAESDKAEGDGSCDFKRGQYYTLSYNYFTDCHKTNLIGSGGTSLTYNVTMHHNWWHNVSARQPLARRANIHYYNNYISGATDTAISARANCYIFAEANYFYGCSRPIQYKDEGGTGVAKAYGNVFNGNRNDMSATVVEDRAQKVSNNCKFIYRSIDYSSFDTNPQQFYYDSVNKRSDCLLQDAVSARKTVMQNAGVLGFGRTETAMNENTPTGTLNVPQGGLTVNLSSIGGTGITGSNKAKGQAVTFAVANRTEISVECSGGVLAAADGTVYADHFTSYKGTLEAGIYFISAQELAFDGDKLGGANLKEVTITALSFKPGETDEEIAQRVIALINAISTPITEDSGAAITAARTAYDSLSAAQKALVTNHTKLTQAEADFANVAITSINGKITALAATSTATDEASMRALLVEYREAETLYNAIPADRKGEVNNYSKVTDGITALTEGLKPYDVKAQIAALPAKADVTSADKAAVAGARAAYNALTGEQKTVVGDITKLTDAEDVLAELAAQTVTCAFNVAAPSGTKPAGYPTNPMFTMTGGSNKDGSASVDGTTYTKGLKIPKNGAATVSFTLPAGSGAKTMTLYFSGSASKKVKVDGVDYDIGANDVATITIEASAEEKVHVITSATQEINLFFLKLEPKS